MIVFETQEEFERAVMEVVERRSQIDVQVYDKYVSSIGRVVCSINKITIKDKGQPYWKLR